MGCFTYGVLNTREHQSENLFIYCTRNTRTNHSKQRSTTEGYDWVTTRPTSNFSTWIGKRFCGKECRAAFTVIDFHPDIDPDKISETNDFGNECPRGQTLTREPAWRSVRTWRQAIERSPRNGWNSGSERNDHDISGDDWIPEGAREDAIDGQADAN